LGCRRRANQRRFAYPLWEATEQFGLFFRKIRFKYTYGNKEQTIDLELPPSKKLALGRDVTLADEEFFKWTISVKSFEGNASGYYKATTLHVAGTQKGIELAKAPEATGRGGGSRVEKKSRWLGEEVLSGEE